MVTPTYEPDWFPGVIRPWRVMRDIQDLLLPQQSIQQPPHPQSESHPPRSSETVWCAVWSKWVVGLPGYWIFLTRRVILDDVELNLAHLSFCIAWCTSGANSDLPSWCFIFNILTYLDMSSPFKPLVFISAGFSVPFTLFSFSLRLMLSCCSHRYDVSMWRSFPSPVRPIIHNAADASAMMSAL